MRLQTPVGRRRATHAAGRAEFSWDVVLLQTVLPDYRQCVLGILGEALDGRLSVIAGSEYFDPTLKTSAEAGPFTRVANRFLFKRRLLWQRGVLKHGLGARVLVAELNPRILSTWALLLCRRLLRRPTILWGHAWPRRGVGSKTDRLRHLQRLSAQALVMYTRSDARAVARRMGAKSVFVAPNAIYGASQIQPVSSRAALRSFLFSGRLVEAKKPELLLRAFAAARFVEGSEGSLPRLLFFGDGPLLGGLKEVAVELGIESRVDFLGHTEPGSIGWAYEESVASVGPGSVGLALTQSLAHGVPMLIARDEPHGPEIEAAVDRVNSLFFESNSVESLAEALVEVWANRRHWRGEATGIAAACRDAYSAEAMAEGLLTAIGSFGVHVGRRPLERGAYRAGRDEGVATSHPGPGGTSRFDPPPGGTSVLDSSAASASRCTGE
jgi:glycosyltransferase involved in cell wall biosynthesis